MAIREFHLTCAPTMIDCGTFTMKGMTYNGTMPGPEIRAELGDIVRITLTNQIDEPTMLHLHGVKTINGMDGTYLQQEPIMPGESFTYEFNARQSGTFMYHSHFDSVEQIESGMFGILIIDDPKDRVHQDLSILISNHPMEYLTGWNPDFDMNDMMDNMDMYCLNGKQFPFIPRILLKPNQVVRIRFANISNMMHPMHIHGHTFHQIMQDANPIRPIPYVTIDVSPGQTKDVVFETNNPGAWMIHCHVNDHAMAMMIEVIYEGYEEMANKARENRLMMMM